MKWSLWSSLTGGTTTGRTVLAEVRTRGALASLVAATSSSLAISGTYPVRVDTCALALRTSGRVSRRKRRTEGRLAALSPRGNEANIGTLTLHARNFVIQSSIFSSRRCAKATLSTPFEASRRRRSTDFRAREALSHFSGAI